jgi:hypothetical protein
MEASPLAESQSAEAVNAQAVAAEAIEKARMAQLQQMIEEGQKRTAQAISEALHDVFDEKRSSGQFIDVSRIPLICQSIVSISGDLKDIKKSMVTKEQFVPIRTLVYGACLLVLIGFFGSIIVEHIPNATITLP